MKFTEKLSARIAATRSALCVGLDPRPQSDNMNELADWLRRVVEETAPYAAAYKPNIAYFEAMGLPGLKVLEELLPDMPMDISPLLEERGDKGRGNVRETAGLGVCAVREIAHTIRQIGDFRGYNKNAGFAFFSDQRHVCLTCS